jgi:glutathione S-transferase
MNFIATDIHKNFSPLFSLERNYKTAETQNEVKNVFKTALTDKFNFIAEKLGQNDYLTGTEFTIADAYLFTCLTWTKYVGMELTNWTNLNSYVKRVSERPAVIRAMKEEGILN